MGKWGVWQDQKHSAMQQGRRRYLREQAEAVFNKKNLRKTDQCIDPRSTKDDTDKNHIHTRQKKTP